MPHQFIALVPVMGTWNTNVYLRRIQISKLSCLAPCYRTTIRLALLADRDPIQEPTKKYGYRMVTIFSWQPLVDELRNY